MNSKNPMKKLNFFFRLFTNELRPLTLRSSKTKQYSKTFSTKLNLPSKNPNKLKSSKVSFRIWKLKLTLSKARVSKKILSSPLKNPNKIKSGRSAKTLFSKSFKTIESGKLYRKKSTFQSMAKITPKKPLHKSKLYFMHPFQTSLISLNKNLWTITVLN